MPRKSLLSGSRGQRLRDERGGLRAAHRRHRTIRLEQLEGRSLMAYGDLPFGAVENDTGEFMLGDVRVSVVRMESTAGDPNLPPGDNGVIVYPGQSPIVYEPENWDEWSQAGMDDLRKRIQDGLDWWRDTFDALPNIRNGLLNFSVDWTYFDNPVPTGYEPIARQSNDNTLWVQDFLDHVGFSNASNPNAFNDIRGWNNYQRQQANADWSFTIFVANDKNDVANPNATGCFANAGTFASGGSFCQAFSYAGGLYMVVPASRSAKTFAHETGHLFWALDEYLDDDVPAAIPDEYLKRRGYHNTQNVNAADNPAFSTLSPQQPSIMSNDTVPNRNSLSTSYALHTLPQSTREMVGWRDTNPANGVLDILDVPFSLTGTGAYDHASGFYYFNGETSVRTLPNENPYEGSIGLQNDITINQIRGVEINVDDGGWSAYPQQFDPRTYQASLQLDIDLSLLPAGEHTIKIRTVDTRTGVMSNVFEGSTVIPTQTPHAGLGGFVFHDDNLNGSWDAGELPYPDFGMEVVNEDGQPVDLQRTVEPDYYDEGTSLNTVPDVPGVALSAVGPGAAPGGPVFARDSSRVASAGNVFGTYFAPPPSNPEDPPSQPQSIETWTSKDRRLKVGFDVPVGVVSIRAYRGNTATRYARLEAYGTDGTLLERVTAGPISATGSVVLALSRSVADIDHIIVGAHGNWRGTLGQESAVVILDTLDFGPSASATTNAMGAYSFAGYPEGIYRIRAVGPPGYVITTPSGGEADVTVAAGQSTGANFGIGREPDDYNPWHNYVNRLNVNGDPANTVSPLDLLIVFNWINSHPGDPTLPRDGSTSGGFYIDVDNNGYATALDALLIINHLNSTGTGGEGENAPPGPGGSEPPAAPPAEGEDQPRALPSTSPTAAADLFAALLAPKRKTADVPASRTARAQVLERHSWAKLLASLPIVRRPWMLPQSGDTKTLEPTLDLIAADVSHAGVDQSIKVARREARRR